MKRKSTLLPAARRLLGVPHFVLFLFFFATCCLLVYLNILSNLLMKRNFIWRYWPTFANYNFWVKTVRRWRGRGDQVRRVCRACMCVGSIFVCFHHSARMLMMHSRDAINGIQLMMDSHSYDFSTIVSCPFFVVAISGVFYFCFILTLIDIRLRE